MTNSTDLQQRQIALLEQLRKDLAELSASLKSQGRIGEQVVRAVTNLASGLKEHADEHYRWMRLQEQRHEQIMGGLVETIAAPKLNGHAPGAKGAVPVVSEKPARGDVSASIAIGHTRIDISEEHYKLARGHVVRWTLAILGMLASAGATWLAGHVK